MKHGLVLRPTCYKLSQKDVLRDDNLEDDIQCVNKIFRRHGFHAWMMFTHKCAGNTLEFFNGCEIKNRKGPLPRFEAQASSMSKSYARPNRTSSSSLAEDMEPSASSHERYHTSAEELIHNTGGDFSAPPSSSAAVIVPRPQQYRVPSMPHQAPPVSTGNAAFSTLYGHQHHVQHHPASLSQPGFHLGPGVVGGASINGQNVYLGSHGLTSSPVSSPSSFSAPLSSSGLASHLSLSNPLSFGSDLSLLSSPHLLTPQASQLTPIVHPKANLANKAKPGVIQRLQGAVQNFRPLRRGARGIRADNGPTPAAGTSAGGPAAAASGRSSSDIRLRSTNSGSDESTAEQ